MSLAVLRRAAQRDMLPVAARVLSKRLMVAKHRQVETFEGVREAMVRSISIEEGGNRRPLPVQVDGDYIGEYTEMRFSVAPGALTLVA